MDKALYPAPVGIDEETSDGDVFEFDIVSDEPITAIVDLSIEVYTDFGENLAETMDSRELYTMASDLVREVDNDKASRKDWEKAYTEGLKLLGLQYEERTEPWNGACGVFHPMITEAVVRFQSETITETFPAAGPVRTKIIGKETPEKKASAKRVENDMNYQLTDKMVEFRPEHERMLWSLPATGSAFKKVYYDPSLGRQTSLFCPAEDIVLPYGTSEIQTCPRVTHIMRKTKNEILKLQAAGFYMDIDLGEPMRSLDDITKAKDDETGFSDLNDDRYTLYEIHADLAIEDSEFDIAIPYVVTLLKGTNQVLAVRRNWEEADSLKLKRQHFVHYQYIPGFGAYGFGLFHLIGGFAKSATSIMRQLVDAGTLSNLPGGLKSRGLRIKGDDTPISPGEFRDVDVGSGTIRDNILPLPYKEPSQVLYTLLGNIVDEGRRFAATADLKVSDMSGQAPVGTTLALLERQLKVMTAVQARVHYAFKQELKLLANIIEDYTEDDYTYQPETGGPQAKKSDYGQVDIIPVSDPNAATMSQRVIQYQAVIQMSQMAPQIYDLPELHRGMLDVLGIKNAAKLIPLEDDMKPKDPISENMGFLNAEPNKAFIYQDHEAHIAVHTSFMQDPMIAQTIGQSPMASQMQAAIMAHVAQHVAFSYRNKIEERLGASLPPPDEKLTPEIEVELSRLVAEAAKQLLQINKGQAAQAQAQQQAQDPIIQMQQAELQLKGQEVQIKGKKVDADIAIAQQKLQIEAQKSGVNPQDQAIQAQGAQQTVAQQAMQAQQAHEMQMRQAQAQAMAQQEQQRQQAMQSEQAHSQGLTHKQQVHQQKLALAAQKAAQMPKAGA
jgi:hypothetical protein